MYIPIYMILQTNQFQTSKTRRERHKLISMGISKLKPLVSLHLLLPYSCFHPSSFSSSTATTTSTTSSSSSSSSSPSPPVGKVISSVDGRVMIFHHPIPAGQVMVQYPLHLICRSDSFLVGRKVPPLSPSDDLIPGHSYFLLPSHFFHSVLSFLTLSSSLFLLIKSSSSSGGVGSAGNGKKKQLMVNMFDIRKTDSGVLEVRIKEEGEEDMSMAVNHVEEEEEEMMMKKGVCTSEGLLEEYKRLVGGRKLREWKPRLETIRESSREKKKTGLVRRRR